MLTEVRSLPNEEFVGMTDIEIPNKTYFLSLSRNPKIQHCRKGETFKPILLSRMLSQISPTCVYECWGILEQDVKDFKELYVKR